MRIVAFYVLFFLIKFSLSLSALELSKLDQTKIDDVKVVISLIAQDIELIEEVKKFNEHPSVEVVALTNDNWKSLSVASDLVRQFTKNKAAHILKKLRKPYMTEMFVSLKDGTKLAFLEKTSSWSHKGKDKHERPMKGQIWQGSLEYDDSAGVNQVQIAVPIILESKEVIGSLVVGVSIARL